MSWRRRVSGLSGLACVLVALVAVAGGCGSDDETKTVLVSQVVPTPATTPSPPRRALPELTGPTHGAPVTGRDAGEVTGGGAGGDPAAAARINAQYPIIPGDLVLTDAKAFDHIGRLARVVPSLNTPMSYLTKIGQCAIDNGVVGARFYMTPDYAHAGAIVVVSRLQTQRGLTIAANCLVSEVLGGGPSTAGPYRPCFTSYSIENAVSGVVDRYYIFTGGTNQEWCAFVRDFHRNFNPQPIRF